MRQQRLLNTQGGMQTLSWLRPLALTVTLALLCAGCGKRSPLIPPPDPAATVKEQNTNNPNPIVVKRKKDQGFTKPDQPFILDPIL